MVDQNNCNILHYIIMRDATFIYNSDTLTIYENQIINLIQFLIDIIDDNNIIQQLWNQQMLHTV